MALYLLTIKRSEGRGGIRLEKGMSVEVASLVPPLSNRLEQSKVKEAFQQKYGVDLEKAGVLSSAFFEVEKIN
jgi:hypothetical protein